MAIFPLQDAGRVDGAGNVLDTATKLKNNELLNISIANAPAIAKQRQDQADRLAAQEQSRLKEEKKQELRFQAGVMNSLLENGNISEAIGFAKRSEFDDGEIENLLQGDQSQIDSAKAQVQSIVDAFGVEDRKANSQFGTGRPVIATTQNGVQINGTMQGIRHPDTGIVETQFIPDVPSQLDQNDPIVSTVNVDRSGLTGAARSDLTQQRQNALEEKKTTESAKRTQADTDIEIASISPKALETERVQAKIDAPEKLTKAEVRIEKAGLAINDIDDAVSKIGPLTTGVLGWVAQIKPGSDRRDLEGLYVTLRSRLGIESLGEMREQSADGSSGFGQLNELELRGIQAAVSNLDANLSPEQQIRNLNILRRHVLRQRAVAVNVAKVSEGLLTEAAAQKQVRRDWLDIDLDFEDAVKNDQQGDMTSLSSEELRKAAGLE